MTPSAIAKPLEIAPKTMPISVPTREAPLAPVVVRADGLGKKFRIYERPIDRLQEWLGRRSRAGKPLHTDFWAVRGVSFEVRRGECLGIVGANGSGKSTLLKMIAGALHATEGSFSVDGRVLSLLELGAGLNPMLSGRANIVSSATLLGFPASFAREKMDEIESFAELREFFDRQVALYSSGMKVRLAFSMFACFRPEVFIVDEALSVGDVFFQQKCAARIREMMATGMTMIFVSHDQAAVLSLCTRAIVLSEGKPIFQGGPDEAVSRYLASLSVVSGAWTGRTPASPAGAAAIGSNSLAESIVRHDVTGERRSSRHGTGELLILAARVQDVHGNDTMHAHMGEKLAFQILLEAREPIESPRVGIRLFDRFSNMVFAAGTYQLGYALPSLAAGERLVVTLTLTLDVQPDKYTFGLGTGEPVSGGEINSGIAHDRIDRLGPIVVDFDPSKIRPFYGAARLPMSASHATGSEAERGRRGQAMSTAPGSAATAPTPAAPPAPGKLAFIVGCGRSGTTILGTVLSHHSGVSYVNDRFDLWIRPFAVTDIWDRRFDSHKSNPRIELTADDAAAVPAEGRNRFYELLELERAGKQVLVEKLAINNFRVGFLMGLCPDAAIISIVRHGVEVAYSIQQKAAQGLWYGKTDAKWGHLVRHAEAHGYGRLIGLCKSDWDKALLEWRMSVEAAERYLAASPPGRLLRLRYEELIADPPAVCERLRAFLGLPESSEMTGFAQEQVRRQNPAASHREIPDSTEAIAGDTLRRLGYTF